MTVPLPVHRPNLLGFLPVWQRNFLVWRKLALPSILGNLADPLIYMLGLGYGLGGMLPQMNGVSYVAFLAAGTVVASTMNAATFEALYSGFSRMHVQKTWDAILNTPLGLADVVAGELFWAATKSLFSGAAILVVIAMTVAVLIKVMVVLFGRSAARAEQRRAAGTGEPSDSTHARTAEPAPLRRRPPSGRSRPDMRVWAVK